jgi:hypothetical protein
VSDSLGSIPIPPAPVIGAFPLTGDYGSGVDFETQVATHVFDAPGLMTEQRYLVGSGVRRFRFHRDHLACNDYNALKSHWQQAFGQYAQFSAAIRTPGGVESVTARYENPNLQFDHLQALLASNAGLTLLEVPSVTPPYTVAARVERFPDSALTAALEAQVQQFIPLVMIYPRGVEDILWLSNQRCSITAQWDGPSNPARPQVFLPRLTQWNGIGQTVNEASDSAEFTFGNADDVFTQYGNSVNLFRAEILFSLFHVNTGYLIDLWSGYARPWTLTSDGAFVLPASDGLFELTLGYPWRMVSRTCWKVYKGPHCPSTSSHTDCPKDFTSCVQRGVPKSFGGVEAQPIMFYPKDIATGVIGYGRSLLSSVSITNDTAYQRPVQEVYTDKAMKVTCDVAAGREENDGEFYAALGIVSEGPIGGYSKNLIQHKLDNQPPHDPLNGGGWRGILGSDPAATMDFFAIDQKPFDIPPFGASYAAGLAFAEIRRTDEIGLQLVTVVDRTMTVTVEKGIGGWIWTAPGARIWKPALSNPVWVAVNVYLRAIGLRIDEARAALIPASIMEQFVHIPAAIAAAGYCDEEVDSMIVPGVEEKRFTFRGVLKERKPLKDWLTEILNCCCGYYTFVAGKLWIGVRADSTVKTGNAFTRWNILLKSLQAAPLAPRFNWLVGEFGDEEFDYALNSVTLYDIDHAKWLGDAVGMPQYLQSNMNFVGVPTKSQCARIITTRLREELGGANMDEYKKARNLRFRTTLLALRTMVGDVISLDHERLPDARGEGRVQSWALNPDFSIDITAACTTDSMYNPAFGPSPADVPAITGPPETLQPAAGLAWMPNLVAPFAGDPLYPDWRERTFDLWQDYSVTREGIWSPAIWVAGEEVVNRFAALAQPRITNVSTAAGGHVTGPVTVYVAVTQKNASGQAAMPSNLFALWIPSGLVDQKIVIDMIPATSGAWTGWDLYVGTDRRRLALQEEHTGEAMPLNYAYTGFLAPMTRQLPEAAARRVRISAKHVWHSGIAGVLVTEVPADNQIRCADYVGSTDNWVGRIVSALADLSDGSAPLWNFTVTAFDSATGTFTVSPNCRRRDGGGAIIAADSVEEGDVLVMRSIGVSSDWDWVEDPMWNNSVSRNQFPDTAGLRPDEEKGRLVRILRGTGAGQLRAITANTETRVTVTPPFAVKPDATSIVIIEAHDWDYASVTSELIVPQPGDIFELRVKSDNLANLVALVGGFLVDDKGRISHEEHAVYREIFLYGQPPTVREIGPKPGPPPADGPGPWDVFATDHTVRADTSENDIEVQLMPIAAYAGRGLYLVNDNGPNNLIVHCAPGELLFDGNATVTVEPTQALRVTAG